jgi:hypothetical protein
MAGLVLSCSTCCVVADLGCIGLGCHIICVMFSEVGGNAQVEWGHAVYGYCNGCVCLVWVCGRGCKLYGGGGGVCSECCR